MLGRKSTSNRGEAEEKGHSSSSRGIKRKIDEKEGSEYLRPNHHSIRSTNQMDYQLPICKDYKDTGFCGFGDSCKFLHDRSDYKSGAQIEQDCLKGQYKEEDENKFLIKQDEEIDGTPLNCNICRKPYKDPIMTSCKHYFCIDCAEKECTDKCFTCEQVTSGIFKNAKKIIEEKLSSHNPNPSVADELPDSETKKNISKDEDKSDSESSNGPGVEQVGKEESSDSSDYYD